MGTSGSGGHPIGPLVVLGAGVTAVLVAGLAVLWVFTLATGRDAQFRVVTGILQAVVGLFAILLGYVLYEYYPMLRERLARLHDSGDGPLVATVVQLAATLLFCLVAAPVGFLTYVSQPYLQGGWGSDVSAPDKPGDGRLLLFDVANEIGIAVTIGVMLLVAILLGIGYVAEGWADDEDDDSSGYV